MTKPFLRRVLSLLALLTLSAHSVLAWDPAGWVPPDSTQWVSLVPRIGAVTMYSAYNGAPVLTTDRVTGDVYAVPISGGLFKSTDQGQTFQQLAKTTASWGYVMTRSLYVLPESRRILVLCGPSGYSTDYGATFTYFPTVAGNTYNAGLFNWDEDSKIGFAQFGILETGEMYVSRNTGKTWAKVSTPDRSNVSLHMALLGGAVMMVQSDNGSLLRSADTGKTWQSIPRPAAPAGWTGASPVSFADYAKSFKDKTYWLTNAGVYTTADTGKNWTPVGGAFPNGTPSVFTGPFFGKDENQMLVLAQDRILETVDGGATWHTLAWLPLGNTADCPVNFLCMGYDPLHDILYFSYHGHNQPPFVFARLQLGRWGAVDTIAPSKPVGLKATLRPPGNGVRLSWSRSTDNKGIYRYQVYKNGALQFLAKDSSAVFVDLTWGAQTLFSVRAVDNFGNLSDSAELAVDIVATPDPNATYLTDLKWLRVGTGSKTPSKDLNGNNGPLVLANQAYLPNAECIPAATSYSKGLGFPPNSTDTVIYVLGKQYTHLLFDVGNDYSSSGGGGIFVVYGDRVIKSRKDFFRNHYGVDLYVGPLVDMFTVDANVTGVDTLKLVAMPPTNGRGDNLINCANPVLYKGDLPGAIERATVAPALGSLSLVSANPFTDGAVFRFQTRATGDARLALYELSGKLVRTLVNAKTGAGVHTCAWDGKNSWGARVPAGIYLARFEADGCSKTIRTVVIR